MFITKGPPLAIGSPIGLPAINKNSDFLLALTVSLLPLSSKIKFEQNANNRSETKWNNTSLTSRKRKNKDEIKCMRYCVYDVIEFGLDWDWFRIGLDWIWIGF